MKGGPGGGEHHPYGTRLGPVSITPIGTKLGPVSLQTHPPVHARTPQLLSLLVAVDLIKDLTNKEEQEASHVSPLSDTALCDILNLFLLSKQNRAAIRARLLIGTAASLR